MTIASPGEALAPAALRCEIEPDPAISPGADFYRHVNRHWIDTLVLPPYRAEATLLSLLSERIQAQVAALVDAMVSRLPGERDDAEQRVAALHASFMDTETIENLGAAAYAPGLARIRSAQSREELSFVMGGLQACGVGGAVEVSVVIDTVGASDYVLTLAQGGIGLPAQVYLSKPGQSALLKQYSEHVATMLGHAGAEPAAELAATVLRMETELAAGHAGRGPDGRPAAGRSRCRASDLAARRAGLDWQAWLTGLGSVPPGATVDIASPGFLTALELWWSRHAPQDLKAWLTWRYVHEMVPFGAREVFADNFRFYGRALNGFSEPRPRPMRAVSIVETFFGDVVGRRYVATHLDPGAVSAARDLVAALVSSYRRRLEGASWLSEATRAAALRKLEAMVFEIGFPATPAGAGDWRVDPADLVGNVTRGRAAQVAREISRLGRAVDRCEWKVDPHQATAYYRHGLNQVVVPAGVLQEPLFSPGGDPARNFAILGAIICHEMSHAFDSRGASYDEIGRIRNWWDPQDLAELKRRTGLLVDQFSAYSPRQAPDLKVSGARTAGENAADIVGLRVALDAFTATLRERGMAGTDSQAEIRRFFVYWASMWRARCTLPRMKERVAADRHAPPEFRCNGAIGHIDEFYEAFGVGPDDPLFIEPDQRFRFI